MMYVIVGELVVDVWESIDCCVSLKVLVSEFDFVLRSSNGHVMLCKGMVACSPIWCRMSYAMEGSVLNNGLERTLFGKFVLFIIAFDVSVSSYFFEGHGVGGFCDLENDI